MSRRVGDARRDLGDLGEEAGAVMDTPARVSVVGSGPPPELERGTTRVSGKDSGVVLTSLGGPRVGISGR